MFNFHVRRNSTDSPNTLNKWSETPRSNPGGSPRTTTEVGEIDTSAPFASVKAALSLFAADAAAAAAGTSPRTTTSSAAHVPIKPKPKTADHDQRVLEKETQIHLALKELEDFKERLKTTQATKAQAVRELEKANKTLQDLTNKLEIVSESKQIAIESAEAAKLRAQEIEEQKSGGGGGGPADARKQDVDSEREQYRATSGELISEKQELTMLRQDFDGVLEAKLTAFQQAADSQHLTQVNKERVAQISKEITSLRETMGQVKLATLEAKELHNQHSAERETKLLSHSKAKEELDLKIRALMEENDPDQPPAILEQKLEETTEAVKVLEEQLKNVRDSDTLSLNNVTLELDDAKKKLEQMVEEEKKQRSSVDSLSLELENVRREHSDLKEKTMETEKRVQILQAELEEYKTQLKAGEDIDPQASLCDDMKSQLQQLELESEKARQEAEQNRKNIGVLRQETETACIAAREAEERLIIVLNEVEEAKAAERHAGDMIHRPSSNNNNDPGQEDMSSSGSSSNGKIKLSVEEFERLSKKAEESRADADLKVATIMAQIETIKASENEALKKTEAFRIEKEATESAIEDALKQAEMAEAAKQVVEAELMKWRQRESFNS